MKGMEKMKVKVKEAATGMRVVIRMDKEMGMDWDLMMGLVKETGWEKELVSAWVLVLDYLPEPAWVSEFGLVTDLGWVLKMVKE